MFISKHHYAVELAKRGNKVFFLNSPEKSGPVKSGGVIIEPSGYDNLRVIRHRFFYPYIIKHKFKSLHNILLKYHVSNVLKKIGTKVDIVWSFDVSDTISLKAFPHSMFKIFMPVDEPKMPEGANGAETADVLLSVTNEIISKYDAHHLPAMFVNHGVSETFMGDDASTLGNKQVQVGLSGNFLRPDIDWETLKKIVTANPDVIFNFWGAYDDKNANLSDAGTTTVNTPKSILGDMPNAMFHGAVSPNELAEHLKQMDCFLICYDIVKDQSGGTNYHKVLEYIATGKVIVANNITTYASLPDLVVMPEERNNNKLPALFTTVINDLGAYNSTDRRKKRITYARQHTYANNINRIEEFITTRINK